MARIAGIDLPRDKRIEIALTYIFGIGRKTASDICAATGVDPDIRVRDLSEDDATKLRATSAVMLRSISRDSLKSAATAVSVTARACR